MKRLLTLFLLLLLAIPVFAQPAISNRYTFGGPKADEAQEGIYTSDGGFLFVGFTYELNPDHPNLYLVKSDPNGLVEWSGSYGGTAREYGYSVCCTPDGGYIATGFTSSMGNGSRDVYIIKVDSEGNEVWSKTYGSEYADGAYHILPLSTGGYLVTGFTGALWDEYMYDVYLLKIDEQGDTLWTKTYEDPLSQRGYKTVERIDGEGYAIGGITGTSSSNNREGLLLLTDLDGVQESRNVCGGGGYDWTCDLVQHPNGMFYMVGEADVHRSDFMQLYLTCFSENGTWLWHRLFGESAFYDYGRSIIMTPDRGFLIVGASKELLTFKDNIYVVKVDSNGYSHWRERFGETEVQEWISDVIPAGENHYALFGYTTEEGGGGKNAMVATLDFIVDAVPENEESQPHGFYLSPVTPNPFNPTTEVEFSIGKPGEIELAVYDIQGRLVRTLLQGSYSPGIYRTSFDASGYASGSYFVRLDAADQQQMQKIVLLR